MNINIQGFILVTGFVLFSFNSCTATQAAAVGGETALKDTETTVVARSTVVYEENNDTITMPEGHDNSLLDITDIFKKRDLKQTADLSEAAILNLESNSEMVVTEAGIYILNGDYRNTSIVVAAGDDDKVQFVLDNLNIRNDNSPAIYVKTGDKVFITTTDSSNSLEVSDSYIPDGDTNLDAVIFSRSDLVFNGTGTLEIVSKKGNGIASKDDLKITGGSLDITSHDDGLEANDSIVIYDGTITITAGKDGLHSENKDDDKAGYIYMYDGVLDLNVADDGLRGQSGIQIDGGTINIETCTEGIEATRIQINDGHITIKSDDDGINAARKSSLDVFIEVNGGHIDITMASGDTDAFDANGDLYINGGTLVIEARSAFDADGNAVLQNADVMVNGEAVTEITAQQRRGRGKKR